MSLSATWFAHHGDVVDVRTHPAPSIDELPFAVLRFGSSVLPYFVIQSTDAEALREIASAAAAAATWLESQPEDAATAAPIVGSLPRPYPRLRLATEQ